MNILKEYFSYKLKAKGRHGVHSPFVYDFIDKCITSNIPKKVSADFSKFRNLLKKDKRDIQVKDLGAGSQKLSEIRKINEIAKVSGSGKKYGKLLYRLSNFYQPKNILELGTSLGLGSFMLAKGNSKSNLDTVEACPQTLNVAKNYLSKFEIKNINFHESSFTSFIKQNNTIYDLIFIDGDHRSEKLKEQLELLSNQIHDETIIILDDIRWSDDMLKCWKEIINNNNFHLTIDLFRMGIIMKRSHQQKEHFVVNY